MKLSAGHKAGRTDTLSHKSVVLSGCPVRMGGPGQEHWRYGPYGNWRNIEAERVS